MKRTATAVTVITLAFAFVGAEAPASSAAIMLYQHKNFGGGYYNNTASGVDLAGKKWFFEPGSVDDAVSSFENTSGDEWYLYDNNSCTGVRYVAKAHSEDSDLSKNSGNPSNFDNTISCVIIHG